MNNLVNYSQILTGYVGSESFLRKIRDVVMRIKEKNPSAVYLCDPVLGDNGHFYVPESLIPIYQNEVLPLADITTPNNFELELLSGMKVTTEAEALTAMDILHQKGIPIVVLSSLDASGTDLASYVSLKDSKEGTRRVWKTIIPRLQGIFTGTGDLFAALFLGVYSKLGKQNLPRVLETTLSTMKVVLGRTKEKADQRKIPVAPGEKPKPSELQLVQSLDVILNPPSSCAAIEVNSGHLQKESGLLGYPSTYTPTRGEPWPKPQHVTKYGQLYMVVRPPVFRFETVRHTCDLVEDALKRYYLLISQHHSMLQSFRKDKVGNEEKAWKGTPNYAGYLDVLKVDLMAPCEAYPNENMDESYELKIDTPDLVGQGMLIASSNWGLLRGLETFSQLLYPTSDFAALQLNSTLLFDFPRFSYRSVLLDTSRHYLSKQVILENLEIMAMNKYNVFHWHIVDDQSFPYQSRVFPELSEKGAYHPYLHIYTQEDIAEIVEFARRRGIRVIPEFDTPGHVRSWGNAWTDFLTKCYNSHGKPDGTYGPINPLREDVYKKMKSLLQEIIQVFPDSYVHLGGDEVDFNCWKSNPEIQAYMQSQNLTDYGVLESSYMLEIMNIVKTLSRNTTYVVWQEVFDHGAGTINQDAVVSVWKSQGNLTAAGEELDLVTSSGYRAIFSSCWYLDYISTGRDWPKYYLCDPQNFNGTSRQKRLVIGGGAALWGEYVDSTNLTPRLWPRASAPAERLWSSQKVNNTQEASHRLEEHRCRLVQRGFNVQPPNGPSYCIVDWNARN
ncbi:Beta-hexosaminidase subunit beta [Orchesella cincta]|uniref:Pyridoxal kinase n=1 Tax=Orchesella cincta TaxID=48709 RepID=A0A1D2MNV3_ORCCI|nr:Beta-hexosaminidase subunit beta [Orchesella cincta]